MRKTINGNGRTIITGNASDSGLDENTADKVYCEAMLTMQTDKRKSEIIREAHRILKKEGLFRTVKIVFNILTHPKEREFIKSMKKTFRKYQKHLNAIAIVAQKI